MLCVGIALRPGAEWLPERISAGDVVLLGVATHILDVSRAEAS
jgi:hypothetical protein